MRAKKLISFVLLATLGTSAQAQIVSSRSDQRIVTIEQAPVKEKKPKERKPIKCYVEVGPSLDVLNGNHLGYDLSLAFRQPFGNDSFFWGIKFGGMSRSYDDNKDSGSVLSINGSPIMGCNVDASKTISVAPFIGPYISYDLGKMNETQALDLGFTAGLNIWINNKYSLGLQFRKGFQMAVEGWNNGHLEEYRFAKVTLSLGYSF